jgi:PKD repeat protein
VWLNYTSGALTVDSTAGKHQRALLHRRATFDPGWLVAVSRIAGVQVRDSVYVRDALAPVPPPPDTVIVVDTTPPPPPNQAPVASVATSCVQLTRVCSANGSASTDDKAVVSGSIAWGDGASTAATTASHTYAVAGTYTIRYTASDAEGLSDDTTAVVVLTAPVDTTTPPPPDTSTIAAPAELPRSVPAFTFPAPTRTRTVAPPMDLQSALNATLPGDEIILGGTFTGEFKYPVVCDATKWVTIRSAAYPADGVRARPSTSAGYAKLIAPTTYPAAAFSVIGPSCNLRLLGIEIAHTPSPTAPVFLNYGLVLIGDGGWVGGGEQQTTLARVPRNIVLDRVYVHGTPTSELVRCITLNGANVAVVNSWIDDCHASGFDSQALEGWNGPGPFLIENNTVIGAGENIMFGGADPGIYGLIPSDITIRRNHIYKPLSWRTSSPRWSVKNLFELKNAERVLLENNVIENNWPASQEGSAIVIKSSHDACGTCTWQGSQHLTIRNNIIRNAANGLNLQAVDGESVKHVAWVTVHDNLFDLIGAEGRGALMLFTHDLKDIIVAGNVFRHAPTANGLALVFSYTGGQIRRLSITGNALTTSPQAGYAIFNDGGPLHEAALRYVSSGSYRFTSNTVSGISPDFVSLYPTGNLYPAILPTQDLTRFTTATAGVVIAP